MKVPARMTNDDPLARIETHCRSLDPRAASPRARLEELLGAELTAKLVYALASRPPRVRRAA